MNNVQTPVVTSILAAVLASVFVLIGFQVRGGMRIGLWAIALALVPIATALLAVAVKRLRSE